MRTSARNILKGTVKTITPGAVNTEVVIELAGGQEVVSIITKESAEGLGLAEQQIQRYESTEYESVSYARIVEIAEALQSARPATVSQAGSGSLR